MRKMMYTALILAAVVTSTSCRNTPEMVDDQPETLEIEGTVVYKNIEGGFYAIHGDDGGKYDPINLPESFQRDGLEVKISARPKRDAMGIHMYGTTIEIFEIESR